MTEQNTPCDTGKTAELLLSRMDNVAPEVFEKMVQYQVIDGVTGILFAVLLLIAVSVLWLVKRKFINRYVELVAGLVLVGCVGLGLIFVNVPHVLYPEVYAIQSLLETLAN